MSEAHSATEPFTPPLRCLNCLTPMSHDARFCPYCGQKQASPHDRSVWHLVVDSVGDFFHVDSKFLTTLRPLLFRPGFLTKDYLAGRKARYFHPFKLFLFISFLYFLVSGFIDHHSDDKPDNYKETRVQPGSGNPENQHNGKPSLTLDSSIQKGIAMSDDSLRLLVNRYGINGFINKTYPHSSSLTKFMIRKIIKSRLDGGFNETFAKTIPKVVFILILFFAFLMKLLYWRRKIAYYDHVIFSLHLLSFFFILFIFNDLMGLVINFEGNITALILLVYLFFAMKNTYRGGYFSTAWKFLVFLVSSLFVIGIFFFLVLSLSILIL